VRLGFDLLLERPVAVKMIDRVRAAEIEGYCIENEIKVGVFVGVIFAFQYCALCVFSFFSFWTGFDSVEPQERRAIVRSRRGRSLPLRRARVR
jgi:hypothetical protein